MKRTFVVKHPFLAAIVGNKDHTRILYPGETVWCDADQMSDPVAFEADLVRFEAVRIEFAKNVESPTPGKRA